MSNKEKTFAVIGDPIVHSLSPVIYNTLLSRHGISGSYIRIQIPKGGLGNLKTIIEEKDLCGLM